MPLILKGEHQKKKKKTKTQEWFFVIQPNIENNIHLKPNFKKTPLHLLFCCLVVFLFCI